MSNTPWYRIGTPQNVCLVYFISSFACACAQEQQETELILDCSNPTFAESVPVFDRRLAIPKNFHVSETSQNTLVWETKYEVPDDVIALSYDLVVISYGRIDGTEFQDWEPIHTGHYLDAEYDVRERIRALSDGWNVFEAVFLKDDQFLLISSVTPVKLSSIYECLEAV